MKLAALGFDLLRPEALAALWVAPLLLAAALASIALRRRERARLVAPRHLAGLVPGWSAARAHARGLLAALGALLLALALVGPVRGYTLREVERRGLDLVIAVDTSRSMLAQDLRPDRLTRAKREVRGLLQRMGGDRAALLAFAGDVRRVAPLTHDRETLAQLAEALSPNDNRVGGTNLGGAIEAALELFDGRTGAHEAIVLVTDGEDHEGQGLRAARAAAERGIRVFVAGIGTGVGGKIPDRHAGFLRDAAGQEVISRLDATTLRRIAEETGGAYLAVGEAPFPLERLYAEAMGRLETRELWAGKLRLPHDRYQWPLVLALGCMLGAAALRERVAGRASEPRPARPVDPAGGGPTSAVPVAAGTLPAGGRRASLAGGLLPFALLLSPAAEGPPAGPEPAPFEGSLAEGLAEVARRARGGEVEEALGLCDALLAPRGFEPWRRGLERDGQRLLPRALALADPLAAALGLGEPPPAARAEVHFARGVTLLEAGRLAEAEDAFHRARALAGPGELAREATYDLALAALLAGEGARARLLGPPGAPAAPGAPQPDGADEEPADPLAEARAHYLRARGHLVEALRLDWRDEDARANTELVQRRLRELDELERQLEQASEPEEGDEGEEGEPGEPGDEPDGEPEDEGGEAPGEDPDARQDEEDRSGDEPPPGGEPEEPADEEGPEGEPDDEPEPEDPEEGPEESTETDEGTEEDADESAPETHLTREEILRLLERLAQLEEQAEAVREALRRRRRVPVERDW